MSYTLGDTTLPTPVNFSRKYIETGSKVTTLDGTTSQDIMNRKEEYVLEFKNLTQAEVGNILSEYNLQTTRNFAVSETNLTISSTPVHIDITGREYNAKGNEYREDLVMVLTEVL